MARFCTECGNEIADGVAFCTECGAKAPEVSEQPTTPPVSQPAPENILPQAQQTTTNTVPMKQQTIQQPVQQAPIMNPKSEVVGTAYYFFMMFVYAIPVVGLLVCIITILAAKNKSRKNFAKAMLIWLIIGLVLSVVLFFVGKWVMEAVISYFSQSGLPTDAGNLNNIINSIGNLE